MAEERVKGNPVAWVLWVAGLTLLGGAAGEVSVDHPGAAQAIGLGLILCTASHAVHLYWRLDPRRR